VKAGMPGSLDIYAGDQRIFSKTQTGKMPQNSEILATIAQLQNA